MRCTCVNNKEKYSWTNVAQHEQTEIPYSLIYRHRRSCTIVENVVDEYWCVVAAPRSNCQSNADYSVLDTGRSKGVRAVAFHPDGKHLLGGSDDGMRRWRLADGQEVRRQTGMRLQAISVSRDHRWVVCVTRKGTTVWDGEMQEKILDVDGDNTVYAVDVSPDSTRFATGSRAHKVKRLF